MKKNRYHLGNILRGFVYGEYTSDEKAWKALCKKFDEAFPSVGGRKVYLYMEVPVKYEFTPGTGKKK